jgi:hypothetical protein
MCEILVEGDKMANVNIAVVLLHEDIFADLISAKMSATILKILLAALTCK